MGLGMGTKATKAVRNIWARLVVQDLEKRGIDAAGGLRKAGLNALALADEQGWIPFTKHSALLDCAADQTVDGCYGARFATKIDIRDGGALGYIGLASKSLEDALRNLERYSRVVTEAVQPRLTVEGETARLEGVADRELLLHCGQAAEFAASLLLTCYRVSTGRHITPIEIRFPHRREHGVGELKQIFGCPVSFNCGHFEQVLNRSDLAIPIPSSDDKLLALLKKHAEMVLSERGTNRPDLLQRLERRIAELLPKGQARAKILAGEMGMSERTFHRRLEDIGITFADLVDRLRHELATRYIEDRSVSLGDVAFLLGYANQSSFSTAFRRWTGQAPRGVRMQFQ
jgi:AraC-like DNA-binding protein